MKKILVLSIMAICALAMSAQLPNVKLQDINGKTVQTGAISNDGKPVIISFWATWCKPCLRELKAIHEVYADWQDETGVKIFAVTIDDSRSTPRIKPFVEGKGWEFDVLLDVNKDLARAMNVSNPPHTFLFDGNGKMVYQHTGYFEGAEEELYEEILKLNK